ncbi:unnamed protein product [Eruca vesicaria subsp. sativa]|uniref:Uncharacterized protein n=1 Tax=Eruca vesicaria subsp. sativa TaxID=29727 RepID=A0ABC8JK20_ERUVS|nr:unnamed protein product [Eruca vesicaria subsp. sativa]
MDEKELDQMRKIIKELTKELKAKAMARNVESYLKTKIKNVEEQIDQGRKENKMMEMSDLIFQLMNGERRIADLSQTEMNDLIPCIDESMECVQRRIDTLEQHPDDTKKTYEGGSSKSGGADDDA